MHDRTRFVVDRLRRLRHEHLGRARYRATEPLTVEAWEVPGEPVPFDDAVGQRFAPFPAGGGHRSAWGRPWGTVWFHATGTVPARWRDVPGTRVEVVVDLGFTGDQPGFQAEATAWSPDGTILKGIEPLNAHVPVDGGVVDLYLEAAANPRIAEHGWFVPTPLGDPGTAGDDPLYTLRRVDVALLDETVWELDQDLWVLEGWLGQLPEDSARHATIVSAVEDALDAIDPRDLAGTAAPAREQLAPALAAPAHASAHRIVATGHAHIDSAWLWPVRETVRKCARTFSNVLALAAEDPSLRFSCSSAQQYAWIRDTYPELWTRLRDAVAAGTFVPVGGMWVESDTNMPGGEALARQLVEGKRFFLDELGVEPMEVWLPDSFGYTAALPQLVRAAGSRWFLTQKISWNDTNRMPHHTFLWEGLDGTRVFTHFPPVDTYNSELSATELDRAQRQYREKGRASWSLVPFGHGDGGGGPTREMLAAARRQSDLEGAPQVRVGTSEEFFTAAEAEYTDPPVWSGELYLEYHRGTYTSQARTKQGNRRCEHLLREAELWAATATVRTGAPYPADDLRRLWQLVLLQQFHDILPGSSIAWVHRDAERNHAAVAAELETVIGDALARLAGDGDVRLLANAGPFARDGAPALGIGPGYAVDAAQAVVTRTDVGWRIDNGVLTATVGDDGRLHGLHDLAADRAVLAPGETAGLQLFQDIPNEWDAWDVDRHYRRVEIELPPAKAVEQVPGGVRAVVASGASTVTTEYTLAPGGRSLAVTVHADWQERQKLLKLAFPLDVHAERATSEIQFGHLHRPLHANTSWDAARFETCAHRFVHVGEPGYGVAVANDATYGHDVTRSAREGAHGTTAGTTTLLRLSVLRAPQFPDPQADSGAHTLRYSITPGAEIPDAVREGYRMNLPLREVTGTGPVTPLVTVDDGGTGAVVVEAVKLADDGSGDVVVRLYEAHGGRADAHVAPGFDCTGAVETDLLERPLDDAGALDGDLRLRLRPFQVSTLRLRRN
ncbi:MULTISPECIES: glycoside hydrolase family 38 C-terminal domain-containing protein [unclassified Pseudonocardia]|uniref:alpha-mannosidase n=1 Tax=unclassified Pseudonocardia TaxID=2619320 RepID=UPI0001FFEC18|nr:glycoside hydrolase family 38 C-terminal domain-containing protein [Pseudonocardia sp. Ae707_Ps1]OLM20267.1 Alpha-mannosidase [Pseudonocardia sp. Ae707_Ps1]